MGERTMEDFRRDLAAGAEYEDYVQAVLWSRGVVMLLNRSAKWQHKHGESLSGIEVKLDRNFRRTGNLYIETAERRTTTGESAWRGAGVYDTPRPRLVAIGDRQTIYLLSTTWLLLIEPFCDRKETGTSRGYLVPTDRAKQQAVEVIDLGGEPS